MKSNELTGTYKAARLMLYVSVRRALRYIHRY
jgi:hypothetical protein